MKHDVQQLRIKIDNELHDHVSAALAALKEEEHKPVDDIKLVDRMLLNIANVKFQNDLVTKFADLYKVNPSDWLSKLDANDMLLCLDDCVYDVANREFREGLPSDMVSMSTGHKRKAVEEAMNGHTEKHVLIQSTFDEIHQSKEVRDYVLNNIATSIVGIRERDRFQIWTGTGANGKGLTKNLAGSAFGEYYYEPASTLFADRSVTGSCLSSELAKLKGKRLCISSEAEPGDKLRAGLLKQCTGHDLIQARDIYKSASEFRCQANIVFCFNEVPGVDDSSGGIARRLDMIHYPFKFEDNPKLAHEKKKDESLHEKFKSKEYGACFLGMMIKRFNEVGSNFETPEKVKVAAKEYIGENDVLGQFMKERFEQTSEYGDKVKLSQVWSILKKDRDYFDQLGLKQSRDLCQKLRNKGYTLTTVAGSACLRYFVFKDDVDEDPLDES